jgi:uncharacterized protein YjiS (DUF1127 family)
LLALTQSLDTTIRQRAFRSLGPWSQWSPRIALEATSALSNLDEVHWTPAAGLLQQLISDGSIHEAAVDACVFSLTQRLAVQMAARDVPALQRLRQVANFLTAPLWPERARYRLTLSRLSKQYVEHELLADAGMELAAAAVN